jgi:hypothetical protein
MIDPERPIRQPAEFIGQKSLLRRIFSRVGTERPQSVAVIGGAKTGKTSLLNCIADPSTREQNLEATGSYLFFRLDGALGQAQETTAEHFLAALCAQLGCLSPGPDRAPPSGPDGASPSGAGNPYTTLQRVVERQHAEGRRLVLLLDDFHLITSNSRFPLEFFSFLRSLANNYNLAYLTTSFLELQKLCVIKDIEESPFFNIFTNLSLGPLSVEEGEQLLAGLTGRKPEEFHELVAWCGTFPYVLKLTAASLESSGTGPAHLNAEKLLLPLFKPYFERVLSILPPEALGPLKSIARDRDPDPREVHSLRPLIKQGFLQEREETVRPFSPAFGSFLKQGLSRRMLAGKG